MSLFLILSYLAVPVSLVALAAKGVSPSGAVALAKIMKLRRQR